MICGIYVIENKTNGMKYVGQSSNLKRRINAPHDGCLYLSRAFEKYGKDNFEAYVIEYCDKQYLDEKEKYYIKELQSHSSQNGYNISWGGKTPMKDRKHTKESKEKISLSISGEKNPMFNKKHSKETRLLFSIQRLNNKNGINNKNGLGHKRKNATSKYYGVSWNIERQNWYVGITLKGKGIRIGSYKTEADAAKAYDKYIIEHDLENPLNFKN